MYSSGAAASVCRRAAGGVAQITREPLGKRHQPPRRDKLHEKWGKNLARHLHLVTICYIRKGSILLAEWKIPEYVYRLKIKLLNF